MTQPSRTTESMYPDYGAMRRIMHRIREDLTVADRARLAIGLVGHLATLMNRHQMAKLLDQLEEEAVRVQDVPPLRGVPRPEAGRRPSRMRGHRHVA
jgi:hypothetical protein